jgi:2,3-bisphosphoglycerate-independent phosphoglycerate mutase
MDDLYARLKIVGESKIVLLVMDGLGGFRTRERGSELFEANTPNLDRLASEGSSGVHTVVAPGITPGSGAGHLALFGYDPLKWELGRGALSAAGIGFELDHGDVAARVNFCSIDDQGVVVDRRAGRIPTEENRRLCELIRGNVDLGDVKFFIETEREHRALLVLRGPGLSPKVSDTDPQVVGATPLEPVAVEREALATADIAQSFLSQARIALAGEKANYVLLRGFDGLQAFPSMMERYGVDSFAIAAYPMYRGIARILGMEVATEQGSIQESIQTLATTWPTHDFFFVHHKATDSAGEDGDFGRKVAAIEEVDSLIPKVVDLDPGVICVTGDHATPSQMMSHSWHPVAFTMWGSRVAVDGVKAFDEEAAALGGFGSIRGKELMSLMLAAAGRLAKFGA